MSHEVSRPPLPAASGASLAALAIAGALLATPAAAQTAGGQAEPAQAAAVRTFAIPPQPLADALTLFGQQAGVQVTARGDAVRDVRSPGVDGAMSVDQALGRLLAGTGLGYRIAPGGTVTVEAVAPAAEDGAILLDPIRVEGTADARGMARGADAAATIAVGPAELERRNPGKMQDVFAGESGISVGGAVPLGQKVYVNGIEETNLAVRIDGARQNNKVFHHTGTNLIDPSLLKAVRVDPGVAPADAGPGALGGAITYETVDVDDLLAPGRVLGGFVTGSYATNGDTVTAGASAYGRSNGLELLGYVNRAVGDSYEGGNGQTVEGTAADLVSGLAKLAYESPGGHRFEAAAERVKDDTNRPYRANIGRLPNRPDPVVRAYDMDRRTVSFTYATPDAVGLIDPEVVLAYSETELGIPEPFGSIGTTSSASGRIANTFNLSPVDSITAGIDFYDDEAHYEDLTAVMAEKARNVGAFAQARLQPIAPLDLSFGLRGDHQWFEGVNGTEIENAGLSGNVSAAYRLTDIVTLTAGYSNVWGGIALAENYILNDRWTYDPDMESVRAQNYTAGIETDWRGLSFGARVFRSDFADARDESFRGGPSLTTDFETRGYTLSAGYRWATGFVTASFTDSEIEVAGRAPDTDVTQYLGAPLGKIIAVEAAHRFDSVGVSVGGVVQAALENTDTEEAGGRALPAYEVVDLYVEYEPAMLEAVTLRLEANNVFDETYADRATYGQDFATVEPLREPGRSFLLKAKATF